MMPSSSACATAHLAEVLRAYRERIRDLAKDPRLEYVMVFKNHGDPAGASLEHTHSQLIATPIVPSMVEEELAGAIQHFRIKQRCIWCDIVRQDRRDGLRMIRRGRGLRRDRALRAALSVRDLDPARGPPVELRGHAGGGSRGAGQPAVEGPGRHGALPGRSPLQLHAAQRAPRGRRPSITSTGTSRSSRSLTSVAGFEWGTGFFINPTPPEEAAEYLRGEVPDGP